MSPRFRSSCRRRRISALTSDHPKAWSRASCRTGWRLSSGCAAAQAPGMIFGCLVTVEALTDLWRDAPPGKRLAGVRARPAQRQARPVATQPPGEKGRDWGRPFVASEIGEALPHWEAALYLMRPQQLQENARGVRRTLIFLIAAALAAIAFGGWLVVRRRAPAARARAEEDGLRFQRFARTEDAADFDPHVCRADAKWARRPTEKASAISAHHHGRSRAAHAADQQRARFRAARAAAEAVRHEAARSARGHRAHLGRPRAAPARERLHHALAGRAAAVSGRRRRRRARANPREPALQRREIQRASAKEVETAQLPRRRITSA